MTSILCTGCSWTRDWPRMLPDRFSVTHVWCDGKGIHTIGDVVRDQGAGHDAVVVQLPTPIRWERSAWYSRKFIAEFLKRTEGRNPQILTNALISGYFKELSAISRLHPRVIFLLFNTGGYPFRAPFDFGPSARSRFLMFAEGSGLSVCDVHLEYQPGFCKDEVDFDDQPDRGVSVCHHPGRYVIDAHPNDAACRLAADAVAEKIHETLAFSR